MSQSKLPIDLPPRDYQPDDSGLMDNHQRGRLIEFLRAKIDEGSNVSIASAYFTIHAYGALQEELEKIERLRFLFGEPRSVRSLDPEKGDKRAFQIEDRELSITHVFQQKALARACAKWITEKVDIRSMTRARLLHGKMYYIEKGAQQDASLGSSNFTQSGIGASAKSNIELNIEVDSNRDRRAIKEWFDALWNDPDHVKDVKQEVLDELATLYEELPPEFVYYKTLFHVFENLLTEDADIDENRNFVGLLESEIWKTLFEFQRDGVKGAINKLNAHNCCILADSVGLGKTYTALAIIKYFEDRARKVLVLCPKKLRENWTVYCVHTNSELNPLLKDNLQYTVLSHSDLSRESGMVGDVNLATFKWGGYDLVVIDESHNFRNNTKGKRDEDGNMIRKSRYERLIEDIIQGGAKTKVLLLSATPVNNDLQDLRNQIYIGTEGDDKAFAETLKIGSIKDTLNQAQRDFVAWAERQTDKEAAGLLATLPSGFFALLDALTIARSRKHLKRYYKAELHQIGEFPKRIPPIAIAAEIDLEKEFPSYDDLSTKMDDYSLVLFNPFQYVWEEHKAVYLQKAGNLNQPNREHFLVKMMKVNFLKRLESSIESFEKTLSRTVEKIENLEAKLNKFHRLQSDEEFVTDEIAIELQEGEEDVAGAMEVGGGLKYSLKHIDVARWLNDLESDRVKLAHLRDEAARVTPERDLKLIELIQVIENKLDNPTKNKQGEMIDKVIVFTAFADTAAYLYDNLQAWAQYEKNVHIAMVSGGAKPNQTTFGSNDFNQILTNFAPRAKQRSKMQHMDQSEEISILIATDCISEGQNLQDCDLLVNYDIHWNPVRIIQRFGRIDRIGSLHKEIHLVNFWPTLDLNKYINLKNRVEARMALADISATAEDNLLDPEQIEELVREDLKYRDKQLMRLKEEILDLEDFQEVPSLGDFTLDDFRRELLAWIQNKKKELEEAPMGLYAVVPIAEDHLWLRPGVIFCMKQRGESKGTEVVNPLQPYYLVYIHDTGVVKFGFANARQVLEVFRDLCTGVTKPYQKLCDLFNKETNDGTEMTKYSDLWNKAVAAIVAQFNKRSLGELLASKTAKLANSANRPQEENDFELVTWLVMKTGGEK